MNSGISWEASTAATVTLPSSRRKVDDCCVELGGTCDWRVSQLDSQSFALSTWASFFRSIEGVAAILAER